MEKLYDMFDKFVHSDWLTTALGVALILGVTAVISRVAISLTRKLLKRGSLLPTSSIFVNVIRVGIWLVGISFMLSTCFNVDVSAIVTGLGVVGIAVSLGFQDTIANLIGGLQVSVSRTVEPGDNIKLGTSGVSGVVRDVTWRYTTVDNPSGTHIVIPNSMMNTTALIHLARPESVSVPLVVTDSEQRLTTVAHRMEEAAAKALKRVDKVKKGPSVTFSEVTAQGFQGSLAFTLTDASKVSAATDAAIRAIAPYCHPHSLERTADEIAEEVGILAAADGAEPPASAGEHPSPLVASDAAATPPAAAEASAHDAEGSSAAGAAEKIAVEPSSRGAAGAPAADDAARAVVKASKA